MILGIIPARGGSKGVPRKNIQPLAGQPLIAYSIKQALGCTLIDRVVVSTEDEEIAKIARSYGADVPFLRPAQLAQDSTPMLPVLQHAVKWVEDAGWGAVRLVVLLQPTSPFREVEDIVACVRKLEETGADSVISVCEAEHSPYRLLYQLTDACTLRPLISDERPYGSRQEAPKTYRETGSVYVIRRDVLMERGLIITPNTRAVILPQERALDIDTALDMEFAQWLMERRRLPQPT